MGFIESISGKDLAARLMQIIFVGVTLGLLAIGAYILLFGDGHEPPLFLGEDTKAEQVILCQSANADVLTLEEVQEGFAPWAKDCWPSIPPLDSVLEGHRCEGWASDGEVRFHSCREQTPNGAFPCETRDGDDPSTPTTSGRTLSRIVNGRIVASDIYLEPRINRKPRTVEHELGHYLGLTIDQRDVESGKMKLTSFGSHTSAATNLMSAKGDGRDRRWLNRCEGGDWPYGE